MNSDKWPWVRDSSQSYPESQEEFSTFFLKLFCQFPFSSLPCFTSANCLWTLNALRACLYSVPAVYFSNKTRFRCAYFFHSHCASIIMNQNHEVRQHLSAAPQPYGLVSDLPVKILFSSPPYLLSPWTFRWSAVFISELNNLSITFLSLPLKLPE